MVLLGGLGYSIAIGQALVRGQLLQARARLAVTQQVAPWRAEALVAAGVVEALVGAGRGHPFTLINVCPHNESRHNGMRGRGRGRRVSRGRKRRRRENRTTGVSQWPWRRALPSQSCQTLVMPNALRLVILFDGQMMTSCQIISDVVDSVESYYL